MEGSVINWRNIQTEMPKYFTLFTTLDIFYYQLSECITLPWKSHMLTSFFLLSGTSHWERYCVASAVSGPIQIFKYDTISN